MTKRRFPFPAFLPPLLLAAIFACASLTRAQTAPNAEASRAEAAAYNKFAQEFQSLRQTDATAALKLAFAFLDANPNLQPLRGTGLYGAIADLQLKILNDPQGALSSYNEGLKKYPTSPYRGALLSGKARALLSLERGDEAEAVYKDWPQWAKDEPQMAALVAPEYIKLLQARGKGEVALSTLSDYLGANLDQFGRNPMLAQLMIEGAIAAGKTDEAVGWAKLYFMVCAFTERDINIAGQLLNRAWTAKYLSPEKVAQIAAAQADPTQPNPLKDVKLPELNQDNLRAQLEKSKGGERMVLLIALGELGKAMSEAQSMVLDRPGSAAGLSEAARVFKAGDLNLVRANAFLEYYRTGKGDNPMTAFLKEYPVETKE